MKKKEDEEEEERGGKVRRKDDGEGEGRLGKDEGEGEGEGRVGKEGKEEEHIEERGGTVTERNKEDKGKETIRATGLMRATFAVIESSSRASEPLFNFVATIIDKIILIVQLWKRSSNFSSLMLVVG